MQEVERAPARRSNRERSETTRRALLDAARELFVTRGYADTTTPEIATAAGTTRGALYHHFADKRDLLRALLEREGRAVADDIRSAEPPAGSPIDALVAGTTAYFDAMAIPGRTRLLLVEGPAALGAEETRALDEAASAATLVEGLRALAVVPTNVSTEALAGLVSAAFDRAALEIDAGADPTAQAGALRWLLGAIAGVGGPGE